MGVETPDLAGIFGIFTKNGKRKKKGGRFVDKKNCVCNGL